MPFKVSFAQFIGIAKGAARLPDIDVNGIIAIFIASTIPLHIFRVMPFSNTGLPINALYIRLGLLDNSIGEVSRSSYTDVASNSSADNLIAQGFSEAISAHSCALLIINPENGITRSRYTAASETLS